MNLKKVAQLHIDEKIIDDDKDIATSFNTFFSKVGPTTAENIPKVPNIPPSKFLRDQNRITFVIAHVSMEEVLDVINLLQNKSSGLIAFPLSYYIMLIPDLHIIPLHRCFRRNNGNEIRKRNNLHKKGNISKDTDDTDTL